MDAKDRPTRSMTRTQPPGAGGPASLPDFGPHAMGRQAPHTLQYVEDNPPGYAALGAGIGAILGNVLGGVVQLVVVVPRMRKAAVSAVGEGDTEEEAAASAKAAADKILADLARIRRISHAVSGAFTLLGASAGAYLGASEAEKTGATVGAAGAVALVKAGNIAINPTFGLPGVLAAAGGAYLGANQSVTPL